MRPTPSTILSRLFTAMIIMIFLAGCAGLSDKGETPAEELAKMGLLRVGCDDPGKG